MGFFRKKRIYQFFKNRNIFLFWLIFVHKCIIQKSPVNTLSEALAKFNGEHDLRNFEPKVRLKFGNIDKSYRN
ncbi:MAG: hypothetical protein COT91_02665 [Candidatus Doudnabacteria bacterium CG10_big_fil_rev_8_21_14_0_10_41_10]|uniref:Uncharacterized protein n=1 Tax=Candidatus Doudnabacteria bacterium CG10_big_fil_rev_8_21_14_0_10_41_10 TaxID=1974551 RepID=A0A2H0VDP2_9BACT|nr:MAG: hypothetical protein COT91_02665 [Candidatus Doudnabacteria bacterium CG10_big_fil_rev_8_21_14_0_10_41_10]